MISHSRISGVFDQYDVGHDRSTRANELLSIRSRGGLEIPQNLNQSIAAGTTGSRRRNCRRRLRIWIESRRVQRVCAGPRTGVARHINEA